MEGKISVDRLMKSLSEILTDKYGVKIMLTAQLRHDAEEEAGELAESA